MISNCSNNYGPWQFPEKLIPLTILKAVEDLPIPIYGNGDNIRDWLYVEDHAKALIKVVTQGKIGETYNIGGNSEKTNLQVVHQICTILEELTPSKDRPYKELIDFVEDRPGHDFRYAIDSSKLRTELGWRPLESFETGLEKTVLWYLNNNDWCEAGGKHYRQERLGII